ncbi:O-antigen ligase family protein [Thermodesulfobacteriota bacterium]
MNNLSTSKPSRMQNTWSNLPWGIFLFLLAVFVIATPLVHFGTGFAVRDAYDMAKAQSLSYWPRQVALISLGAFALFNLLRSKPGRLQINGLLGWLILFYLVWAALSIIWSINPNFTIKRVGILLLFSLGALYVADRLSLRETIALVFFICAVSVLLGAYPYVVYPASIKKLLLNASVRFGGNMHPIAQGWHCGLLLLSVFALSKTAEQNRAVYLGIAFIAFLLLVLTRSRMAFASCIIGSAVYWALTSSKRYQGVLFLLGIIIGGCLIYFLLGHEFWSFFDNVTSLGRGGGIQIGSLTGRTPLWESLLHAIDQRPVAGYGYDITFFTRVENLIGLKKELGWVAGSPHSGYLVTLLGLGYIGTVPLVLILILSVTKSINLARRNPEYAFVVAVLVWLIFNLVTEDQVLTRPYFPVFVWMIMLARLGFIREKR